jgi:hypothetical protein
LKGWSQAGISTLQLGNGKAGGRDSDERRPSASIVSTNHEQSRLAEKYSGDPFRNARQCADYQSDRFVFLWAVHAENTENTHQMFHFLALQLLAFLHKQLQM